MQNGMLLIYFRVRHFVVEPQPPVDGFSAGGEEETSAHFHKEGRVWQFDFSNFDPVF